MACKEAPRRKAKLTQRYAPAELERALADPAFIESLQEAGWTPEQINKERKTLRKRKARFYGKQVFPRPMAQPEDPPPDGGCRGGTCPSHSWADAAWIEQLTFPPPGMAPCLGCAARVPPIYLGSSGHCMDCRLEAMPKARIDAMQSSASVVDFRQLRRRG